MREYKLAKKFKSEMQGKWHCIAYIHSAQYLLVLQDSKWYLIQPNCKSTFAYLGFYIAFNTVQVISRRVVGRAEETSTYSSLGFCTVNCRPTASNYQLSHLRPWRGSNPGRRGGRRECYHSATVAPLRVQPRLPSHWYSRKWKTES